LGVGTFSCVIAKVVFKTKLAERPEGKRLEDCQVQRFPSQFEGGGNKWTFGAPVSRLFPKETFRAKSFSVYGHNLPKATTGETSRLT